MQLIIKKFIEQMLFISLTLTINANVLFRPALMIYCPVMQKVSEMNLKILLKNVLVNRFSSANWFLTTDLHRNEKEKLRRWKGKKPISKITSFKQFSLVNVNNPTNTEY